MANNAQKDDLFHSKKAVAALIACLVQTIRESDHTFDSRFLKRLTALYYTIRDNPDGSWPQPVHNELELLSWTREYLTGFDFVNGQQEPLLHDYKPTE